MRIGQLLALTALPCALVAQAPDRPPPVLPPAAATQLAQSLDAASAHARHVWRDTPALDPGGTVHAYIEIPRGERRKYEFDMRSNARKVDRVMPESLGGYPVNYGFVPQTVSYDGDPLDALVLGLPLPGGEVVRGIIIGVMHMDDEKGHDSKVVLARVGADGRPLDRLTSDDRRRIGDFFDRYKRHEAGKFSRVTGWGPADEGARYVRTTHAFFRECGGRAGARCEVRE